MKKKLNSAVTKTTANTAIGEIIACNDVTERFGLQLSHQEVQQLVVTGDEALKSCGRIEMGSGIIKKLIMKFCSSPFLSRDNYAETLHELIKTFYYFKNESLDHLTDDELLSVMKEYFDKDCQGSVYLLQNTKLENLARSIRGGYQDSTKPDENDDETYAE
jgi:hypothetical protein